MFEKTKSHCVLCEKTTVHCQVIIMLIFFPGETWTNIYLPQDNNDRPNKGFHRRLVWWTYWAYRNTGNFGAAAPLRKRSPSSNNHGRNLSLGRVTGAASWALTPSQVRLCWWEITGVLIPHGNDHVTPEDTVPQRQWKDFRFRQLSLCVHHLLKDGSFTF